MILIGGCGISHPLLPPHSQLSQYYPQLGLLLLQTDEGSLQVLRAEQPSKIAGIEPDDHLWAIDGCFQVTLAGLESTLQQRKAGTTCEVWVTRDDDNHGRYLSHYVTLR